MGVAIRSAGGECERLPDVKPPAGLDPVRRPYALVACLDSMHPLIARSSPWLRGGLPDRTAPARQPEVFAFFRRNFAASGHVAKCGMYRWIPGAGVASLRRTTPISLPPGVVPTRITFPSAHGAGSSGIIRPRSLTTHRTGRRHEAQCGSGFTSAARIRGSRAAPSAARSGRRIRRRAADSRAGPCVDLGRGRSSARCSPCRCRRRARARRDDPIR